VHSLSRGTYGFRRVHAEPTLGRGLTVGPRHRRAADGPGRNQGCHRPAERGAGPTDVLAMDLVDGRFARAAPDQLWLTDIERHEALLNRAVVEGHRGRSVAAGR
jgi:transposase InsO family protein